MIEIILCFYMYIGIRAERPLAQLSVENYIVPWQFKVCAHQIRVTFAGFLDYDQHN